MSTVTHPKHYNTGKIEVIEIIEDQGLNFHLGNSIKYICRAGKKSHDTYVQDLEKAVWYLKREIEVFQSEQEKRTTVRPNAMNPQPSHFSATAALSSEQPELPLDTAKNAVQNRFSDDETISDSEICGRVGCGKRRNNHLGFYSSNCFPNASWEFMPTGNFDAND